MRLRLHLWKISRLKCVYWCSFQLFPYAYFTTQAVRTNLQEALRVAAGNGTEEDKLEARIEADVYESLQYALGSK